MAKNTKSTREVKLTKHRIAKVFIDLRLNDPGTMEYMKYLQNLGQPAVQEPMFWIKSDSITCSEGSH